MVGSEGISGPFRLQKVVNMNQHIAAFRQIAFKVQDQGQADNAVFFRSGRGQRQVHKVGFNDMVALGVQIAVGGIDPIFFGVRSPSNGTDVQQLGRFLQIGAQQRLDQPSFAKKSTKCIDKQDGSGPSARLAA